MSIKDFCRHDRATLSLDQHSHPWHAVLRISGGMGNLEVQGTVYMQEVQGTVYIIYK